MAPQGGVTEIVMVHLYYLVAVKKEAVAAAMMNKQRMQWLAYCSRKATLHRNTSCSCCCLNSVFFWEECCCLNSWAAAAGLGRKPQAPACATALSTTVQLGQRSDRPTGPALGPLKTHNEAKKKKRENRGSNPGLRHKTRPTYHCAPQLFVMTSGINLFIQKCFGLIREKICRIGGFEPRSWS